MPIEMPTSPGFTNCVFGLESNTQRFESPVTRNVQRMVLAGARWNASYSLPAMNRRQAQPWKAFFLKLEGSANTFYGFDPDAKHPLGPANGSPAVNGAGQSGSTLNIDGCAASVTNWMMAGDYFGVNGELHMLTAPANTNGSGQTALQFKPALRSSPADNAVLTIDRPACAMILTDDRQAMWECDKNGIYQPKTFTAMEVF